MTLTSPSTGLFGRASPDGTFAGTPPAHLPAENGVHVWRAAVAAPFFTAVFVGARLYTKARLIKKRWTLDDYIVVVTLLVDVAYSVLMANAAYNGMGLHVWQYDDALNARYYLWVGIASEFYVLGLMGFKVALVLLYLQLFGINRRFRWACFATLFFTVGYLLCNLLTEFLGCSPIAKKWHPDLPGHCINSKATDSFYGACSMASDLVIAILPLTMIWTLQFRSRRQKLGLTLILCCGFLSWAIAVTRWAIAVYDLFTYDRPWWAGLAFALSVLEVHTGLVCACIATLGPLWQTAYVGVRDWTSGRSRSSGSRSAWGEKTAGTAATAASRPRRSTTAAAGTDREAGIGMAIEMKGKRNIEEGEEDTRHDLARTPRSGISTSTTMTNTTEGGGAVGIMVPGDADDEFGLLDARDFGAHGVYSSREPISRV
ncbi:hypothetical protein GGR56DRAFT_644348 [Xylariaceae sp. FL0804]|nr:hypothetical protein GGR56DRAFT_644348 [Xylariaceae sp. FL0804]